jgi:Tfp pilus assembly major pilin PilA
MELMLVLGIMVVLGSFAVPIVENVIERQKLRGAADEMRMTLESARMKAMRTGQAQVFKCQVGSNGYIVQPLITGDDESNASDGATIVTAGVATQATSTQFGMTTTAVDQESLMPKTIDDSISFFSCAVDSDLRAYTLAQTSPSTDLNISTVGEAVVFFPDGTTSTAEIRLVGKSRESISIQLRGLTGQCRITELVAGDAATAQAITQP